MRTWKNQFNGFKLEKKEKALNALGFIDESWGNDICPKFVRGNLTVWIDYLDPELREIDQSRRYCLTVSDVIPDGSDGVIIETDSWTELLDAVRQASQPKK